MADYIGEIGSFEELIHGRDGDVRIVREYRVTENPNDRDMLRVEYTDAYAVPGAEFLGSRGWVRVDDHRFSYTDII